jgi:hypothetical protein
MADQHDHQIGGKIIGALVMEFLAAHFALILHFEEFAKDMPLAAVRAAPAQAVPQVGFEGMSAHGGAF